MTGGTERRRYRVLDVLGRGGFGTVYRAEMQGAGGFSKEVALKVLNQGIESNPHHLARLRDEARVLGLIRHRAIVAVDGLLKLNDRWTVVMELVPGVTLKELLDARGPLPIPVALQICEAIASALHAAYTATDRGQPLRLLHRDVKPSNIQLTAAGDVKLLDFGIARAEFASREAATRSEVMGSLPYMAPERLSGVDSHAADVYALAVSLVQLLSGRMPARHTHPDPAHHAARVEEAIALLSVAVPPPALIDLERRALSGDPDERPDAREFERLSRQVRGALPDVHLSDWADAIVPPLLELRGHTGGEFTGMMLVEAATTEQHRHLAELLGTAIPATFDDPVTDAIPVMATPPPAPSATPGPPPRTGPPPPPSLAPPEMPSGSTSGGVTTPLTAVSPVSPVSPPLEPRSASPRRGIPWLSWVLAGGVVVGGGGLAVALGLLVLTAGGTALFGGLIAAIASDNKAACASVVDSERKQLATSKSRGRSRALAFLERMDARCATGRVGFTEALWISVELDERLEDGALSDADVRALDAKLDAAAR